MTVGVRRINEFDELAVFGPKEFFKYYWNPIICALGFLGYFGIQISPILFIPLSTRVPNNLALCSMARGVGSASSWRNTVEG